MNVTARVADELRISEAQTTAVLALFEQGCTVPFIARYRKEATGSLDEAVITAIRDRNEKILELEKRRAAILESLSERELLTDELRASIEKIQTMTALEDAYMPYRPKRKTRASVAAEKGLSPLAEKLFSQLDNIDPIAEAAPFLSEEKGVTSVEGALVGAMDILAERFNENAEARHEIRKIFARKAALSSARSKGAAQSDKTDKADKTDKKTDAVNYQDYFDWSEQAAVMPSHRVLAIFRGEREGFLSVSVEPKEEECLSVLKRMFVKGTNAASRMVADAVTDSYKRLLKPSMRRLPHRQALQKPQEVWLKPPLQAPFRCQW
jgi:uncharacterized protein